MLFLYRGIARLIFNFAHNNKIRQEKYFVLHAPKQTGKTSYLMALMNYLNKEKTYKSLYMNIETAQAARENVREGI